MWMFGRAQLVVEYEMRCWDTPVTIAGKDAQKTRYDALERCIIAGGIGLHLFAASSMKQMPTYRHYGRVTRCRMYLRERLVNAYTAKSTLTHDEFARR